MKKTTAFILSLVILVSMTACGSGANPASSGVQETASGSPSASSIADISGEITGEITVSSYDTMQYKAFLDEAAKLFEEKYPGTKVNVETFSAMPEIKTSESGGKKMAAITQTDDAQGRTDYINKVNTSLMSGEGADILAMDVLPFHKYADGGQIENLASYMEADPDFNREDYRQNILDAIAYKGGTWLLPLDYTFEYYAYDSTLLAGGEAAGFGTDKAFTAEQLIDVAAPSFDGSSKLFNVTEYTPKGGVGMFNRLLAENYASFADVENKKADFTGGGFVELLNAVKEYAEKGYIPQSVMGKQDAGQIMGGKMQEPTTRYYYKPKNNFSLTQQYNKNSGRKVVMFTAGAEIGIEDDDKVAGIAADKNGNVPFEFGQAYGINSNSKNKQTAWAFLKFLLGEDMQLSTNLSMASLPLHNAAREKKAELVLSGAFINGGMFKDGKNVELDSVQQDVLDNYKNAVEQLSGLINTYNVRDSIVDDMISSETRYFFSGEKSADEVAQVLQSKVDLYLNE